MRTLRTVIAVVLAAVAVALSATGCSQPRSLTLQQHTEAYEYFVSRERQDPLLAMASEVFLTLAQHMYDGTIVSRTTNFNGDALLGGERYGRLVADNGPLQIDLSMAFSNGIPNAAAPVSLAVVRGNEVVEVFMGQPTDGQPKLYIAWNTHSKAAPYANIRVTSDGTQTTVGTKSTGTRPGLVPVTKQDIITADAGLVAILRRLTGSQA